MSFGRRRPSRPRRSHSATARAPAPQNLHEANEQLSEAYATRHLRPAPQSAAVTAPRPPVARPKSAAPATTAARRPPPKEGSFASHHGRWQMPVVLSPKKRDPLDELSGHRCGGKELTHREKALVEDYVRRRNAGLIGDEGYWKAGGFKVAGGQKKLSKEAMRDYGFGIPKWSPYSRQKPGEARFKVGDVIPPSKLAWGGDTPYFSAYGFKGTVSEEKKRDYGNGVPKWSPYHRSAVEESSGLAKARFITSTERHYSGWNDIQSAHADLEL